VGGIRMNEEAFEKLKLEVSLKPENLPLPALWGKEEYKLYSALVTVGNDIFRKIVVRESHVAHIEARTFSLQKWADRRYFEVCTEAAIYEMVEGQKAAVAGR